MVEQIPPTQPRQFIDVFEQGKILTRGDAEELVKKNTDRPLQESELEPVTKKKIVSRIVQNLLGLARDAEDAPAMLRYIETLVELDPTSAQQRWLRAVFRFELGMLEDALVDTGWLLQTNPEGVDLGRVKELQQLIERRQQEGM